jgi:NADH-ubiquinone oxidoreductase chain 5
LIKRFGDGFILSSMSYFLYQGHYKFYLEVFGTLLLFNLILGLLTKRAHFPFSSWLPAAMAAPTPVSALVHSSTLVSAGIIIIVRLGFFFSEIMSIILMVIGLITMYLGC